MESWVRHSTARNQLFFAAGPLFDWKWAVDKVVVHYGIAPMMSSFHSFNLRKGKIPERPNVSIHVDTHHKANDPISFPDYRSDGFDIQWALNQLSIPKSIRDLDYPIRFDVKREILQSYYEERFVIDTNLKKPTAKQPDERMLTNVRGFQKLLNREFSPGREDISPNSQAATFLLGGGSILKSAHDAYLRFPWTLPTSRAQLLFKMLMQHE